MIGTQIQAELRETDFQLMLKKILQINKTRLQFWQMPERYGNEENENENEVETVIFH